MRGFEFTETAHHLSVLLVNARETRIQVHKEPVAWRQKNVA